jgi:glycosyltransferase involved in cell wall biosynthesis
VPIIIKFPAKRIVDITDITRPITHNRLVKGLTVDSVERHFMEAVELVIVQVKEKLEEYSERFPDTVVRYVPNGVDVEGFRPTGAPRTYDCCYLGKIEDQYHVRELIGGIARSGVKALFIGGGPKLDRYQAYARERGADISFQGYVPHEEVALHLNRARFGLQPARHGGPLKLYEYLACGLPVVTRQAPDESIRDGIFLINEGTEEEYGQVLSKLSTMTEEEYGRISRRCREESLAFSMDAVGRKYSEAIAEVLA